MRLENLGRFGLSGQIIKRWNGEGIRFLLPLQSEAVSRFGLLEGKSAVISGPGTSGKTFCGELAAMAKIATRQKASFLVPLKAIAEEKYRLFKERYGRLGIRTCLATRDHTSDDLKIIRGEFDIAIFIYEKFNSLTASDAGLIKGISCFVIDELQTISDPRRGMELELIAQKIKSWNPQAQVVALIGNGSSADEIAGWLGFPLIEESRRPVDLRLGVLHRGNFHFRGFNDLNEGDEHWLTQTPADDDAMLSSQNLAAIKYLAGQGEQILIFTSTRKSAIGLASHLSSCLDIPPAKSALAALDECPPSLQNESLRACLEKGLAFHHAELDEYQRALVESGFRSGEIRILSSTSTLASGVNLPAKNVFIETLKYQEAGSPNGRDLLVPLSSNDFHQAAGRAGRLGQTKSFGRAIMTASTPFEQEVLWDKYIYGRLEAPPAGFSSEQLPEFILRLVSCGAAARPIEIEDSCRGTYGARVGDLSDGLRAKIDEALLCLEKGGLLAIKSWGKIEPTRLGQAASGAGLSVRSAIEISEWLAVAKSPDPLDCLLLALRLPEWSADVGGYRLSRVAPDILVMRIYEILGEDGLYSRSEVARGVSNFADIGSKPMLAAFLFSLEWMAGRPTRELESFFGKGAGGLKRDSATVCWLLRAIDRIARAVAPPSRPDTEPIPGLTRLTERIRFGVDDTMLPLAQALGLDREFVRRLYENGIVTLDHLYDTEPGTLAAMLPKPALERVEKWRKGFRTQQTNAASDHAALSTESKVIFSGNRDRQKNEAVILGHPLFLQARLYNYLQKLWWGYTGNSPWVHKDSLDTGPNQARYLSKLRRLFRENEIDLDIVSDGRGSYSLKFPE